MPEYRAPSSGHVDEFVNGLIHRGVHATRRRQIGTSIDAARGQLHAKYLVLNSRRVAAVDTELIPITPVSC